jgi:hypothetical protein
MVLSDGADALFSGLSTVTDTTSYERSDGCGEAADLCPRVFAS